MGPVWTIVWTLVYRLMSAASGFARLTFARPNKLRDVYKRQTLEAGADRYLRLMEYALDTVTETSVDGRYLWVSPNNREVLGYEPEELLGKSVFDLVHPDDRPYVVETFFKAVGTMSKGRAVFRFRHKNGEWRWLESQGRPFFVPDGGVRTSIISRDVTGRQRMEEALRGSEARNRAIIDTAYDALVAIDPDSVVTDWNRQAEITFGWPHDEIVGKRLVDTIIPPRYRELHLRGLQHFLDTGEGPVLNKRIELTALNRDGREFPVELTIWPTRVGEAYKFNAFLHDISERRRAEKRLAAQYAASVSLVESAALREAAPRVLEAICVALDWDVGAIWTLDQTANILRCFDFWHQPSRRFQVFEKITREITFAPGVGLPGRVWAGIKPQWIGDVARDPNFPRAPHAAQDGLHSAFGFPILSGNECVGVIEFFSQAIQEPDEDLLKMMTTIGNLLGQFTERRRLEESVRRSKEELERRVSERTEELKSANKELEAFSYSVSHDLRAPLRTLDGFSAALIEDYGDKLDERGKHFLERVRTASRQMAQLIDDMLNLSQVTRAELRRTTVDLTALVHAITGELQKRQPERRVEFVIAPGMVVNADPRALRIVLENLLDNAWKFTGKHPQARIELGVARHDGAPAYFVRDDGAGFDMAYAGKLFGPFQRLHATSEFEGTGVGLATVQRIIHRHGGRVWGEGRVEGGATFYFTLPGG